jgi:hypothetical protein
LAYKHRALLLMQQASNSKQLEISAPDFLPREILSRWKGPNKEQGPGASETERALRGMPKIQPVNFKGVRFIA